MRPVKDMLFSWKSLAIAIGIMALKLFVAWQVFSLLWAKFHPLEWLRDLTLA